MITTKRIRKTLEWVVSEIRHRFDMESNPGNYSTHLQEAIDLLEEIQSMDNTLLVDLSCIPEYQNGSVTEDDISAMIMDTLKMI